MSVNVQTISGNVGDLKELRKLPDGRPAITFTLAYNARRQNDEGEWENGRTTWVRVEAYGRYARNIAQSLRVGMHVMVTGRLQVRSFENNDGQTVWLTEIVAREVAPTLRFGTVKFSKNTSASQAALEAPLSEEVTTSDSESDETDEVEADSEVYDF